ncbi:MAG: RHS repeat protein [Nannocystaceae bacterium]|nr:RHS repeat protein [Nannocystaceae bacterium]
MRPADALARDPRAELTAQLTRLAEALGLRGKVRVVAVKPGVIEAELEVDDRNDTAGEFTELMAPLLGPERYTAVTEGQAALAAEANRWELTSCALPDGATIDVPMGSFSGAGLVGVTDEDRPVKNDFTGEVLRNKTRRFGLGQLGHRSIGSGWDFEPGALLYSVVAPMVGRDVPNGSDPSSPELWTTCEAVQRFIYVGPSGRLVFEAARPDTVYVDELTQPSAGACWENLRHGFYDGATYLSTDGRARLDGDRIVFADGHVEVFRTPASGRAHEPFDIGLADHLGSPVLPEYMRYVATLSVLDRSIDANGNVVQLEYDGHDWVTGVVDPDGIRARYARDTAGRVEEIGVAGIGGVEQVYDLIWTSRSFDPRAAFPDAVAMDSGGFAVVANPQTYTTLAAMVLPDGRRYDFEYGAWGNPTRVVTPDGAVREFDYGDASTFSHRPPGNLTCPNAWDALRRRRVVRERVLPAGAGGPVYTTALEHEPEITTFTLPTPLPPNWCSGIAWVRRIQGEGATRRTIREGRCLSANLEGIDGRTLAQELRDADDTVIDATYFGDPDTGELFVEFELAIGYHGQGHAILAADSTVLDVRHTRIDHVRDGVRRSERFVYDLADEQAMRLDGSIVPRTRGNVVEHTVRGPDDAVLSVTRTRYESRAAYLARNLVRLPIEDEVRDGLGHTLSRSEIVYDEDTQAQLARSGVAEPRRVAVGDARGNPTTTRAWLDAEHAVVGRTSFYDNGAIAAVASPRARGDLDAGFTTTTVADFEACSESHPITETQVRSPVPGHGATTPHVVVTRADCWTGATLSVTAADGALSCTRYDALGRPIEEAAPGDTLTRGLAGAADPRCEPSERDVGPTASTRYELAIDDDGHSVPGLAHVVTTRKNGGAGVRSIAFADGLGRAIASCSELDPEEADGNLASCVQVEFDFRDLAVRTSTPTWLPELPTRAPTGELGSHAIVREYDALGRETLVELEGAGLGPSVTDYRGEGGLLLATVTDRNGYDTTTATDVLGNTVRIDREWLDVEGGRSAPCSGGSCTQRMGYDALGRLLWVTEDDESTVITRHGYDWLGRRVWTVDLDLGGFARSPQAADTDPTGRWRFAYDESGNEIERIDPAGNTLRFEYDAIDRVVRKTMPSTLPGDDDENTVTWFYDGAGPQVPQ